MSRSFLIIDALFLSVSALFALSPPRARARSVGQANVQYTRRFEFDGKTKVETSKYTVQDNMDMHQLKLGLDVRGGTLSWSFSDPLGKVHWDGELEGGQKLEEERTLPRIEGDWTLKVAADEAVGTVTVRWQGKG